MLSRLVRHTRYAAASPASPECRVTMHDVGRARLGLPHPKMQCHYLACLTQHRWSGVSSMLGIIWALQPVPLLQIMTFTCYAPASSTDQGWAGRTSPKATTGQLPACSGPGGQMWRVPSSSCASTCCTRSPTCTYDCSTRLPATKRYIVPKLELLSSAIPRSAWWQHSLSTGPAEMHQLLE